MRGLAPWVVVAAFVHGGAFAASESRSVPSTRSELPLEIDLAEQSAVEPEPAPPPREASQEEDSAPSPPAPRVAQPRAEPSRRASAPVREAAKAGALLTAGEATEGSDATSFVTDPNGGTYGVGVVARGGTADRALGSGIAPPPIASAAPRAPREDGEMVTPASDLRREARLEEADACRGFFPSDAVTDAATVDLAIVVRASGRVARATVVRESTQGEGFGAAARACLLSKEFSPGVDREGRSVTSAAAVRVRFSR